MSICTHVHNCSTYGVLNRKQVFTWHFVRRSQYFAATQVRSQYFAATQVRS